MEKDIAPALRDSDKEPPRPVEQIRGLVEDMKALAFAELDYAKARLGYSGGILRNAGIYAVVSLALMTGALIALILGVLLIAAEYLGIIGATALVVGVSLLLAVLFGMAARNTARKLSFKELQGDE